MVESGRPIVAAVGLFFGGLIVGSSPGVTRDGNAAHAATSPPPPTEAKETRGRQRGPVAPALHRILSESVRDGGVDVEAPKWSRDRSHGGSSNETRDPNDPLSGLTMPDLPVPREPEVLNYVRYFSESYEGRKIFSEGLRRSGRYEDAIAKTFRELGLPKELLAVAFIESGFNTEALSTAGASGMWQFMPATARAYGLQIDDKIDERSGIWSSTEAAAHHLSDLYARFKSWELALAAYNFGYDALERRLDDMEVDDFWSLSDTPGGLPKETQHYVPKVMGAAIVFANLERLGFGDVERAPAVDAAEIDVPPDTKLAVVARAAGTSVRVLRDLNPELLADAVPDRDGHAAVHVPKGGAARARAMLPRLSGDDPDTLRVSEDFDWGRDDAKSGHSRLERTSADVSRPRRRKHRSDRNVAGVADTKDRTSTRHAEKAHEDDTARESRDPLRRKRNAEAESDLGHVEPEAHATKRDVERKPLKSDDHDGEPTTTEVASRRRRSSRARRSRRRARTFLTA